MKDEVRQKFADVKNGEQRVSGACEVSLLLPVHPDRKRGDYDCRQQHSLPLVQQTEDGHRYVGADPGHGNRVLEGLALDRTEVVKFVNARKSNRDDQRVEGPGNENAAKPDRGEDQTDDDASFGQVAPKRRSRC